MSLAVEIQRESLASELPASLDAERVILGSILLDNDAHVDAAAALSEDDFSLGSHRILFARMGELLASGSSCDLVTLAEALIRSGQNEIVGGIAYVASLTEGVPRMAASSLRSHIRIVAEKSRLRRLIATCYGAIKQGVEQADTAEAVLASLQDGLEAVLASREDDAAVGSYIVAALDRFERERWDKRTPGITYGVRPDVDEFTGGMRPGEVTVVGARSGVGKTSLMCQAAAANCQAGVPVALFSLEMTRDQILRRLWSIVSGVPYKRVTDPWLANVDDAARVQKAAGEVAEWPLRIYDAEDLTLGKILALGRICIRRHKTRLICVDYAQEVEAPGKDERAKVMMVCRRLALLIKHEQCSLMLLSQLIKTHRENYNRPPVVGDLIESGKLENVAHLVLLLHRGWDEERRRIADEAELIIPKQRRGETGVLPSRFSRTTATFE